MKTIKAYCQATAVAVAVALMFAGCRQGSVALSVNQQNSFELHTVTAKKLGVVSLIDAVYTGDDFLLMAFLDQNGFERELLTLDSTLQVTARRTADYTVDALVQGIDSIGKLAEPEEITLLADPFSMGISSWLYSGDGMAYVCSSTSLSNNGQVITLPEEKDAAYYIHGMMTLDSVLYAVLDKRDVRYTPYTWKSTWLCPVKAETSALSEKGIPVPFEVSVCASDGETGWLLSGNVLYRTDGVSFTPYANLNAAGVNTNAVKRLIPTKEGILLLFQDELVFLTEGNMTDPPAEKEIIRIAALGSTYEIAAAEFNRISERYMVEITKAEAAQLNLALANGEADMVTSSDYNMIWSYAKRGLLLPLEEAIPELFAAGMLVENVVDAMKIDGTCWFLPPSFEMRSFMLPEEEAREFTGLGDFLGMIEETYPEDYSDPFVAAFDFLKVYGDIWLDLDKGEAHFDDESFVHFLKFCNTFESGGGDYPRPVFNLNFHMVRQLTEEEKNIGEFSYVPVAVPNEKSGGITLECDHYVGVIKGGNEAGAAEFLKFLMLEGEFDRSEAENCLPTSITRLEQYVKGDGFSGKPRYTDCQQQLIWKLLPEADHVNQLGYDLYHNVILWEANVYFNGDCTLEEAVERIQSRVSLYLAEIR